jgi:hypothetical protein
MNANDLLNSETTTAQLTLATQLMEACGSTTAALLALHAVLARENAFPEARLIDSITDQMAEIEAKAM